MIYFAQVDIPNGPIKIGIAKDINKRKKQFEKHMPWKLNIIAQYPGGREVEKMIHRRFWKFQMRNSNGREWFNATEELLFWMDNIIITPSKIFFDPNERFIPQDKSNKKGGI